MPQAGQPLGGAMKNTEETGGSCLLSAVGFLGVQSGITS